MSNQLIILQLNCRSILDKREDLLILINQHVPDVFDWSLIEQIPGFYLSQHLTYLDTQYIGILVMCRINLNAVEVDITMNFECICCCVISALVGKSTLLDFPPSSAAVFNEIHLQDLVKQIPSP